MSALYFDYAATTPVRAEVRAAMEPFETERFGNPSSTHAWGRQAAAALEGARAEVAEALGARPREIYFVRGGTESDNLATVGVCSAWAAAGTRGTVLASALEHPAVLDAARFAAEAGLADTGVFEVSPHGRIDTAALEERLAAAAGPCLVSVMWVNNETGLVLPVPHLVEVAARHGALVHSDASQAVGKVAVSVSDVPVDLLTATGHKIYGPKGTGILYVRDGTPVAPLLRGGGQERALRPGTEDVPGAVGFATALRLAVEALAEEATRLAALRERLERSLSEAVPGLRVNAGEGARAPHVSSVGIPGVADGRALLMALDLEGLAVSGGSACASGSAKGSHVMSALYGDDDPYAIVRFSLGRGTDEAAVDRAVAVTAGVVRRMAEP